MKDRKLISYLLTLVMVFSFTTFIPVGQVTAAQTEATASKELEDLFTTIDLMDATIQDLQEEMTEGHVTSAQLTQMYIDRIKAYDEKLKLNSIISINPAALSDAEALDEERESGSVRGPLHGIPIVVKANYDVAGMATSAGSNALADMVVTEDSFAVKKLRDAGAVILAQANMSEFASSAVNSRSTLGGYVHNAYDGSKTPAGSSGGTAVAVTCNFAAAGLGTDTGGSIRNPSSFSNLYGLRPSKGLTSISGIVPLCASRDTAGPMARTAADMTLLLETIAGTDTGDDFTVEAGADTFLGDGYMDSLSADGLKGMRIGFLENSFSYTVIDEENDYYVFDIPDEKISAMVNKTRANLRKAGAVFIDMSRYITDDMLYELSECTDEETFEYDLNKYLHEKGDLAPFKTLKEIYLSGNGVNYSNLFEDEEELTDSFEETSDPYSEYGEYRRVPSWGATLEAREVISKILKEHDIDAVMYLSFFDIPPDQSRPASGLKNDASYDRVFGPGLGFPDLSLPMGFSDTNSEYTNEMPLGMNFIADFGNDETLMQIAYAYEQQAGEYIRKMPERTPALKDKDLNAFLEDLMNKVYSIDYSKYNEKPIGKVKLMLNACEKANNADRKDPYQTYEAARELARTYDNVMTDLEASGSAQNKKAAEVTVGQQVTRGNLIYKVTSAKENKGTVTVTGMKNRNKGSVTIPDSIKINKAAYKVTGIDTGAFVGNKKLRKAVIGKNMTKIGGYAFYDCSKLKNIKIKSKRLKKVGKKSVTGLYKKAVIKVPSSKKKAYKKLFKKQAVSVK